MTLSSNNPRGRPERTPLTPTQLLQREMTDAAKMARRVRDLLNIRIRRIGKVLESPEQQPNEASLSEELVSIMAAVGKVLTDSARLLTTKVHQVDETPTSDASKVLEELTKGQKK